MILEDAAADPTALAENESSAPSAESAHALVAATGRRREACEGPPRFPDRMQDGAGGSRSPRARLRVRNSRHFRLPCLAVPARRRGTFPPAQVGKLPPFPPRLHPGSPCQ